MLITQSIKDFKGIGKNAAFKSWQYTLNRGDKLPRGKFFKGKKSGKPITLTDEFWYIGKQSNKKSLSLISDVKKPETKN